jgi:hypothetical protein
MLSIKKRLVTPALLAVLLSGGSIEAAHADGQGQNDSSSETSEPAESAALRYRVVNVSSSRNQLGGVIGSCNIRSSGGTCQISRGKTASRDIQLSLGASRGSVAAGLNISAGTSVATTVSCSSPPMSAGQTWKARAVGTRYYYNVNKQKGVQGRTGIIGWNTVATSGRLTALNPYGSSISCGL